MENSRTKNSILNMSSGFVKQTVSLLLNFFSRTLFIRILGDGCLGLNGLFSSILSMLSLAELGIGQAITFYLYKPIAEKDIEKQASLIKFYKLCYKVIGLAILAVGFSLIPILPKLVNLETDTGYNLYLIYALYIINIAVSYLFFSYPSTVLSANQKQYMVNNNETIFSFLSVLTEIIVLLITHNYICYLVARIFVSIIKNTVLLVKAKKLFPFIAGKKANKIDRNEIRSMFKDVYSIFVVKVSSQLFNSTDNIFISAMFGTVLTGYNSNYLMIINAVSGVITTAIYSFGGPIGNLCALESKEKVEHIFSSLDFGNRWISCVCTVCLFQLLNPFITIVWGSKYTFSILAVSLMCTDFYIVSSLNNLFNFRQCMGLFKYCVYNQFIAAVINIVLDFLLGKWIGIEGLFLATVISKITVSVFPYIINFYKAGFGVSSKKHIRAVIWSFISCFIACCIASLLCRSIPNTILGFILMAIVACFISNIVFLALHFRNERLPELMMRMKKIVLNILQK